MGKVLVFLVGLVAGAAVAHLVSRTPAGARTFAAVNAATGRYVTAVSSATGEFTAALADSYRARLAEAR